ncbi:MAG: hypothetical protein JWR80_9358 [Bradyrhizobium sp.]|jgi:hypothetical protein|nr:hypothetical protein [Bradyrhizobium sp.]
MSQSTAPAWLALTMAERNVIHASLRDPAWSLGPISRVRRAIHWVFDLRRPTPLADPRLEALRRFAVLVRRFGDLLHSAEIDRLGSAGYSASQIRAAARQVAAAIRSDKRDAQ